MKMQASLIPRLLFSALILICSGAFALAQNANKDEYPKVEIFAGTSALGENSRDIRVGGLGFGEGYATPNGLEVSVSRNFTRYIGLKGDFSAHIKNDSHRGPLTLCTPACTTATQDSEVKTRVFNFLVGPEFKARNSSRFTPFAHLLGGVAHTSANFTTNGPSFNLLLKRSDTGFAMGLGGGLDIRATKRVSFRAQMDYNPVFIHDSTSGGSRDFARISLGVLFH